MRTFFIAGIITLIASPLYVFAIEFVELAPIPGLNADTDTSLGTYINGLFMFAITVGAFLAVLRIVIGGFKYMTSEAVGSTKDARETITMAVVGLILLLSSLFILEIINPQITDLSALNFSSVTSEIKIDFGDGNDWRLLGSSDSEREEQALIQGCIERGGIPVVVDICRETVVQRGAGPLLPISPLRALDGLVGIAGVCDNDREVVCKNPDPSANTNGEDVGGTRAPSSTGGIAAGADSGSESGPIIGKSVIFPAQGKVASPTLTHPFQQAINRMQGHCKNDGGTLVFLGCIATTTSMGSSEPTCTRVSYQCTTRQ
jgi:hypothetical protein